MASARVELTEKRLRFLMGDLNFDEDTARRLTGWNRAAMRRLRAEKGISKGFPTGHGFEEEDYRFLGERLNLRLCCDQYTSTNRSARVLDFIWRLEDALRTGAFDWGGSG